MIAQTDYQNQAFAVCPRSGLSFIEQLQISASKQCTKNNVPYLVGVNENAKICLLTKSSCKQWNCETCAARNARTWIAKVINGINRLGGEWSFLTLTSHAKWRGQKSVVNLREGWKKFYNRLLAAQGKSAEAIFYTKVWEQHEDGTFHLHILISLYLSQRWAKDSAARVGLGYQAEWHKVDNAGQVAGYISKYTLKNATIVRNGIAIPKGLRRIETSHKWPVLPKKHPYEDLGWIVKFERDEQLHTAQVYNNRGFQVIDNVRNG